MPSSLRKPRSVSVRGWIRIAFVLWAAVSTLWLGNSIRTRGVDERLLRSDATVTVAENSETLAFLPAAGARRSAALIFICGSGISADAYAPLLRPIAEAGDPVFVIKLPYRFAFFESNKQTALNRVRDVIGGHREVRRWVVAGHSLGGALAARFAPSDARTLAGMVLIGTTHPKEEDLSLLQIPVTKVFADQDGIAPPDRVRSNRRLLPAHTTWVEIAGGNHSQFGRYGHQLFDGTATISREQQESITRSAILDLLARVADG